MKEVKQMLKSNEIINVEGVVGRYTREEYRRDMFSPVETKYSLCTKDLERYIARKINNAKDIIRVFKNLEKQGYSIRTVKTVFGTRSKIPCYNTEIGGIFNGNIRTLNVLWSENKSGVGSPQVIHAIIL